MARNTTHQDRDETPRPMFVRAIEMDGGVIGTSKPEARAVLGAVDFLLDRGPSGSLLELRASLVDQQRG